MNATSKRSERLPDIFRAEGPPDKTARRTHPAEAPGLPTANELEAFSYSASHELRAPLQIIRGFAEAILADKTSRLSDESRAYVERIHHSAGRIDATVSGLLSYARLARESLRLENVPLDTLIADILAQYDPIIVESGAKVLIERGLPVVYGETEALFQALSNLLSNALKFINPGQAPWVRVSATVEDGEAQVSVEDRGIGIAPQNQERIFQLFERLNSQKVYPGTGVGLSLVRRAVEKIGGRVGVESRLGYGSRFWIGVPLAKAGPRPRRMRKEKKDDLTCPAQGTS